MIRLHVSRTWLGTAAGMLLAACGGGGTPFSIDAPGLRITSTSITEAPQGLDTNSLYESADAVDWTIPLAGGCDGPFIVTVISGRLPNGVFAVGGTEAGTGAQLHHLRGVLLEQGRFPFRLQVQDTHCVPFAETYADFTWEVLEGGVKIVAGTPALFAPGTYVQNGVVKNPTRVAIKDAVYGQYTVQDFLAAGGTPPYTMDLYDDPANPLDGALPLGFAIAPFSTSIEGSSVEFRENSPFVVTLRATDSLGQVSPPFTFQMEVVAPPLKIADDTLPGGKAGTPYNYAFTIVDGVGPFTFDFVQSDVNRDPQGDPIVTWQSPLPPIPTPVTAGTRVTAAGYPGATALGPDYRATAMPPEGIFVGDGGNVGLAAAGAIKGTPRRRGQFHVNLRVRSGIIPNAEGQQNWKAFEFNIADSEPPVALSPAFGQNPAYAGGAASFPAVQPYARIGDAEVGAGVYNPDVLTHSPAGLQLLARGGVRKDGRTDAPHSSEVAINDGLAFGQEDGSTNGGGYDWTINVNPAGDGDAYSTMPPGMQFDDWTGIWRLVNAAALVRQQNQALEFTVVDQQLPTQTRHSATQRVNFAVGPDKVIYTESTTSGTTTTGSNWWDMNDTQQTVRVCYPYTGAAVVMRDLDTTDLSATHTVPATTGLVGTTAPGLLLKNQDMLRVSVNPAGWWDDVHNLNPAGARSGLHADGNAYNQYIWGENDLSSASDYSRQPSVTAVDVPAYKPGIFNAVAHAPAAGTYTDGGKMYLFSNAGYFGAFIVRSDSTVYVPFAIGTGTSVTTASGSATFTGFGDGCVNAYATSSSRSQLRVPHMAVSPDGRFAAVKIKVSDTNYAETANLSRLVIFCLTGEKPFGGQTYTIVDTGASGTTTTGAYLYGASMVMTNTHLYYVVGNLVGTTTIETPSRQHFLYRFAFADPLTGASAAGATGTGLLLPKADALDTNWTNTSGAPMQTRFQLFNTPLSSGFAFASAMHFDGQNQLENSVCPIPFRVSADGRAVAILAMNDVTTTGANSQAFHVWVDFQGAGVRRLSSAPRHVTGGSTRGYTLARGSSTNTYENWHRYGGPTPHIEISDDASKVAVVVNRFAGTPTYSSPTTSWPTAREDVIAYRTTDNVGWTELPVTGDGAGTNIFSSAASAIWRFGSLIFTKDNAGLVFFGGFSCYAAANTTSSYQISNMIGGTMYGVDLSSASAITGLTVTSLLNTADGGSTSGIAAFTTASQYNPTLPSLAYSAVAGVIKPYGGFLSRNREFAYILNKGALVAAGNEYPLIGINVRSTNTATNVNGRTDFRGFTVGAWPTRRGFIGGTYNYYAYYGLQLTDYPAWRKHGMGLQIMPKGTGWVFFASQYQTSGPTAGTASSSYGGPLNTTYSYDYASYGGEVEGFNADVGGNVARLSAFNADTAIRRMHFLEPVDGGSAVAFVYDTYATSNGSPSMEQLHFVGGINFNGSGVQTGTLLRGAIESTSGRISDSFAFGSSKDRLYYGAGDATNENNKAFKEVTLTPSGLVYRTLSTTNKRYTVLHAAR